MIFYLHYILMTSGLSGISVLLAVYFREYSDASQSEIGTQLMLFPFVALVIKPLFCSLADRYQAHKLSLMLSLLVELLGYMPFAIIPFFPGFHKHHPRWSWYILVVSCQIGNAGLSVAWSLGDCLAMNYAHKVGTTFGRLRLVGTAGWGIFGLIVGQINETPMLPRYLPAFLMLLFSLAFEIILVFLWPDHDFLMVDPLAKYENKSLDDGNRDLEMQQTDKRNALDKQNGLGANHVASSDLKQQSKTSPDGVANGDGKLPVGKPLQSPVITRRKNPQFALLRMILRADGRLVKYIVIMTVYGFLNSPVNFLFLSMEDVARRKGYNFSQLAGAVLISQAAMETISFLLVPLLLLSVSRSLSMCLGFFVMALRAFFYAGWYYDTEVSPYSAIVAEWSHGIAFGIFCTIQADVSLMFANQCRLYIPELRRLGYLSQVRPETAKELIEAEENAIKMTLRATMQAILDGFLAGLGQGAGALMCGLVIDMSNYIRMWQIFLLIALMALAVHQAVELSSSKFSDNYKPAAGTKADQIRRLEKRVQCDTTTANGEQ